MCLPVCVSKYVCLFVCVPLCVASIQMLKFSLGLQVFTLNTCPTKVIQIMQIKLARKSASKAQVDCLFKLFK